MNVRDRMDPWHLLRYGDVDRGLALVREAYASERSSAHIIELGVAYLWIKDYSSARAHFKSAIRDFPLHASSFYAMAGVSQWCLGQSTAAVEDWCAGLNSHYADTAGLGIRLPLLLFAASVLEPAVFQRKDAEGMLQEKAKDKRAGQWPGTLAKFVLGRAGKEDSLDLTPVTNEVDRKHREWVICFYQHLLEFGTGDLTPVQFSEEMLTATDTSQPECSDLNAFLTLLWSEEFFIARHQAHSI